MKLLFPNPGHRIKFLSQANEITMVSSNTVLSSVAIRQKLIAFSLFLNFYTFISKQLINYLIDQYIRKVTKNQ